ncbi:hypothetical protein [Flavobacterium sp. UBA6031]|uniref:hypothetical protein n=1 Tax=Flavobacterium sp. UBA6031 TaxID=1946551 RepID=UPI0025C4503D|nr:hypothetical protein [Flavobacterium sp. UBA6031]
MKKIKVLLDFIKLAVAEKIAFYRNVNTQLTDNATFPTPIVPLTEAKAAVDKMEASYLASKDGSRTAIAKLRVDEEAADEIFRSNATYVDRISDGEESKILSSGFHISKQPDPIQKAILAVEDGTNSGSVKLVARAVPKAGAYIWQYAKDSLPTDDSGWILAGTGTRSYYVLTGLTVAAKYYFRMAAVTPDGTTDFCSPLLKVIV